MALSLRHLNRIKKWSCVAWSTSTYFMKRVKKAWLPHIATAGAALTSIENGLRIFLARPRFDVLKIGPGNPRRGLSGLLGHGTGYFLWPQRAADMVENTQ